MIIVNGMLHELVCRECRADTEARPYSWKFKGKWVPFTFCINCSIVLCEECLDTDHWKHCNGRRNILVLADNNDYGEIRRI